MYQKNAILLLNIAFCKLIANMAVEYKLQHLTGYFSYQSVKNLIILLSRRPALYFKLHLSTYQWKVYDWYVLWMSDSLLQFIPICVRMCVYVRLCTQLSKIRRGYRFESNCLCSRKSYADLTSTPNNIFFFSNEF